MLPRRFSHPRAAGDTHFCVLCGWSLREGVTFASFFLVAFGGGGVPRIARSVNEGPRQVGV